MREANRDLVAGILRSSPPLSRSALARRTGLTKPTVSAIVDELLSAKIVEELGLDRSSSAVGRKGSLLRFNADSSAYLGIHFGVNHTDVAVADGHGRILHIETERARPGRAEITIANVVPQVRRVLRAAAVPRHRLQGLGVTLPGLVAKETGTCVLAPNLMWKDVPVRALLEQRFGMPTTVNNITQAVALAEGRVGAARAVNSYIWVYVSTGVGSGIVADGQLLAGSHGFSGEIGHCRVVHTEGLLCQCGNRGCLETVASWPAIGRIAGDMKARPGSKPRPRSKKPTTDEVVEAARAGDSTAQRAVRTAGHYLGLGASYLANLFNPELIVLGGKAVQCGPLLTMAVQESLCQQTLGANQVNVVESSLGAGAALIGAVSLAIGRSSQSIRVIPTGLSQPAPDQSLVSYEDIAVGGRA
jgi:predicted NBD/HSP70 family sugar kinase